MKTKLIYFWKTILSNKVAFVVLLIFTCFSAIFYVGLGSSGESLYHSGYGYASSKNFHDFAVVSPLGFSDEDIERLKGIDGIDVAEGSYITCKSFEYENKRFMTKVMQITENVDIISITDGVMPKALNEIAVDGRWAKEQEIKLGDMISTDDISDSGLKEKDFVVTAFVESPIYFIRGSYLCETTPNEKLPVNTVMFVNKNAFHDNGLIGYTQVILRSDILRDYADGSNEYKEAANDLKESISTQIKPLICNRYEQIKGVLSLQGIVFDDVKDLTPSIFTREEVASVALIKNYKNMFDNIKVLLTIPFVIICLLICVSVILRIINSEEKLIGIQLSLGAKRKSIICRYVALCFLPTFLGTVLGCLLGYFVVMPIFLKVFSSICFFNNAIYVINIAEVTVFMAIVIATIIFISLFSCVIVFRKDVLDMINKTDDVNSREAFFEKTKLWHKMPLLTKSIVKNMFTDRLRVFGTLIGVIGCTALLVSSFCVINSVTSAVGEQFGRIQDYNLMVYFDLECDNAEQNIVETLSKNGTDNSPAFTETAYVNTPNEGKVSFYIIASDTDFGNLIRFYNESGELLSPGSGVLISSAYASCYNVKKGDTITFYDNENKEYEVTVNGVFQFFLVRQQLVFKKDTYEKLTGKTCDNNTILVNGNGLNVEDIDNLLCDTKGYYYTYDYKAAMEKSFSFYELLSYVLFVLRFTLSIVLALFMLKGVFSQFVIEKKAELITLMINGYGKRYVHKYLYIDTIFLSVIGLIVGAVVGNFIGCNDITALITPYSYFTKGFDILAILFSIGIAAAFTTVLCKRTLKQIDKLEISDINK